MKKNYFFVLLLTTYSLQLPPQIVADSPIFLASTAALAPDEQLTITTYYPSPFGSYRELRSRRVAIGDNYINRNNACWNDPAGSCAAGTTIVNVDADLVVEGRAGVGTDNPKEPCASL